MCETLGQVPWKDKEVRCQQCPRPVWTAEVPAGGGGGRAVPGGPPLPPGGPCAWNILSSRHCPPPATPSPAPPSTPAPSTQPVTSPCCFYRPNLFSPILLFSSLGFAQLDPQDHPRSWPGSLHLPLTRGLIYVCLVHSFCAKSTQSLFLLRVPK